MAHMTSNARCLRPDGSKNEECFLAFISVLLVIGGKEGREQVRDEAKLSPEKRIEKRWEI